MEGVSKEPFVERLPRLRAVLRLLRLEERGTALVEFALIVPLLFALLIAILDLSRALNYYNQLSQLAGQGARAAAVSRCPSGGTIGTDCTSIQAQLAGNYAQAELKNKARFCISPATVVGQPVTVSASYLFTLIPLHIDVGNWHIGLPATINIQASQTERQEAPPTYSTGGPGCP
jgi:Flp pilus assembly protein TadG